MSNLRNTTCKCGSNKKYKKCHLYIDQGWIKTDLGWLFPEKEVIYSKSPEQEEAERRGYFI